MESEREGEEWDSAPTRVSWHPMMTSARVEHRWVTFNILFGRKLSDWELTRPVVQRTVGGTEEISRGTTYIPELFSGVTRFSRVRVLACTSMTYTNKSQGGGSF